MSGIVTILLQGNEAWNLHDSVDGISPSATEVLAPGHLKVDGLLIWWGDHGKEWWEPFSGVMQISDTSDELLGYQFMFGDAVWGWGKVRYNEHPRGWNWSPPEKWIFAFTKP